ncbi:HAD family hydrolase [Clostridium neuense]|uniref:HAD family hydrolase n=1 Tax=Clostridium neuense TaxID=1728934 RepID=A0ABW8TM07_9CLOT
MNKVIIFDMDGVIVDTEPIYREINKKLYKELGAEITLEEQFSFVGNGSRIIWTKVKNKANLKQSVEELMELSKNRKYEYLSKIGSKITLIRGIEQLLSSLKNNGFSIVMASSSPKKNIEVILNRVKLIDYFQYIVSGEDVVNGKPNPDIFLKAAEKLKAKASDCTVIEDSNNGVTGAKAAGMKCVGFRNLNSGNQDLSKADIILEAFDEEGIGKIIELASK